MGTLMACALAHAADPAASCQTVIVVRPAASASNPPAGPGASVAVPGGSAGGARHPAPGPAMVSPRLPFSTIAAVSPGPKEAELSAASFSRSGGDRAQWLPPSEDQAASRLAAGPAPAASSATVPLAVLVSLSSAGVDHFLPCQGPFQAERRLHAWSAHQFVNGRLSPALPAEGCYGCIPLGR